MDDLGTHFLELTLIADEIFDCMCKIEMLLKTTKTNRIFRLRYFHTSEDMFYLFDELFKFNYRVDCHHIFSRTIEIVLDHSHDASNSAPSLHKFDLIDILLKIEFDLMLHNDLVDRLLSMLDSYQQRIALYVNIQRNKLCFSDPLVKLDDEILHILTHLPFHILHLHFVVVQNVSNIFIFILQRHTKYIQSTVSLNLSLFLRYLACRTIHLQHYTFVLR
jgi:hypothetical protein